MWAPFCLLGMGDAEPRLPHVGPLLCTWDGLLPRCEGFASLLHAAMSAAERCLTLALCACADVPHPSGHAGGVPGWHRAGHRRPSQQGVLPEGEPTVQATLLPPQPSWSTVQH